MYSKIPRSEEYQHRLLEFIRQKYGISSAVLAPAKRGFYGETWRLDATNISYFLKLVYPAAHKAVYERSFSIIQHLCDHGIDFISRIVRTEDGDLSTRFDGATLGVFDWLDGEHIETDATKIPEYQMLAKVYTVPSRGVPIPCEDFSGKCADTFFKQWNTLDDEQVLSLLDRNRSKLEHRATRLKYAAELCRGDTEDFFITHGDAGGNLIVNGDRYFIVDWDNPVLAPPERDAWVMCGRDWARDAFHDALCQSGIRYSLRLERLAYYCYHFFFYYLTAYLDAFTQTDTVQEIEEYIDDYIDGSIQYADRI